MSFEPVIGLEVHAQLLTKSKLFCSCSTAFGAPPNSHVCEVCLGMPGVLPVLNQRAVELATRAALGLSCTVHPRSQWSRKNYFYADLPKGYQISQYDQPIATRGRLDVLVEAEKTTVTVGITRIHMEEDAGKNVHDDATAGHRSYVDFNRGGVPLVEIVSDPDLRSAAQASAYMKKLRQILRFLGVCDGNMEEGSLRCDANVSIRPVGESKLGTRVELKNINSFKFVQQAVDYEILRQTQVIEAGGRVVQETRLWDTQAKVTRSMRGKEEAHDYRYFPDPDLPDLVLAEGFVDAVRKILPELPDAKRKRYVETMGLGEYDAGVLTDDAEVAAVFEEALATHNNPKGVANWVLNEWLRELRGRSPSELLVGGKSLGELVGLIDDKTISGKIAKELFAELMQVGGSPRELVKKKGLTQVSDAGSLLPIVDKVIADNPDSVAKYKAGKANIMGFFVGKVMQATGGKANPQLVNELIKKRLDG